MESSYNGKQGGFATARRPDDGCEFAVVYAHAYITQSFYFAVFGLIGKTDVFYADYFFHMSAGVSLLKLDFVYYMFSEKSCYSAFEHIP